MRRLVLALRLALGLGLALLGNRAAMADDKPWAAGVSQENQDQALALYKEGNDLFQKDQFKEALAVYEKALALWDHPAIRYNAAVCLINLDRPVDAYDDLQAAMRYGEPPLGDALYKQGLSYQKLLAGRIAEVEVSEKSPDAKVTLDGKPLLEGAGIAKTHVLSGDHQIVAEKPGFQTETKPVHVNAGDHVTIVIDLHPIDHRVLRRRYAKWVPWTIGSVGLVVAAAAGVPLIEASGSAWNRYDAGVSRDCTHGCTTTNTPGYIATDESHAKLFRTLSYSAFAIGGVLAASGIALVVLNQPHLVTPAPMVGADSVGMMISGSW